MSGRPLTGPTELLLRHAPRLPKRSFVAEPPKDGWLSAFNAEGVRPATVATLRRSAADMLARARPNNGFELIFGRSSDSGDHDGAIVFLPRERALATWVVQDAAARVRAGSPIWVVGENRAGGRTGGKQLEPLCTDVRKVEAARRSSLFIGRCDEPQGRATIETSLTWFEVAIDGEPLRLASLPGVFAAGRLDAGTALLLECLPEESPPTGLKLLDFGCGCGVIGATIARRWPGTAVTLLDDSWLAVEASRATFDANGLTGTILASDGFPDDGSRYDWILSNPPFHQGKATNYEVAEALIEGAHARLNPRGSLMIVANRFLDYGRRMADRFGNCETLADAGGFRVYRSRRP